MFLLSVTSLVFAGLALFYLRNASGIYFESALVAFLSLFMITIFVASNKYSMLGEIDYPHFYWALLSAPLILFSQIRVVSFIWALLFFVTLIYWLPDQGWFENDVSLIELRALLIYLMPSLLGLVYLGSKLVHAQVSMQKSIQALLFLSVFICFLMIYFNNIISLHGFLPLGQFQIYVILINIAAAVVIMFLKNQSPKQKNFLILAITSAVCVMCLKIIAPTGYIGLQSFILILGLINLLLFYASNQFFWTADALALACCFLLSLSLSLDFSSPLVILSQNTGVIFILFTMFTALYFLILRARIK
ncbi:hypothetical protein [Legionella rowbothamii]|uniref:hypothetical protein n=1 Tax=Legionella rowbothamii TaxID=96229 RepID=UPI001055D436|nr:hypothetical protein [Legionella rowbothamii]